MAKTSSKKVAARRLKVEKLKLEGLTDKQISKRLGVCFKTIRRDIEALNEEKAVEPQYAEERDSTRDKFEKIYAELVRDTLMDLAEARKGSLELNQDSMPLTKEQIKKIEDPETLLAVAQGELKYTKVTKKVFGPKYNDIAKLHTALATYVRDWSKLYGFGPEKEIHKEKETMVFGVIKVPIRAKDSMEWEKEHVGPYKNGKVIDIDAPGGDESD